MEVEYSVAEAEFLQPLVAQMEQYTGRELQAEVPLLVRLQHLKQFLHQVHIISGLIMLAVGEHRVVRP